ncbi:flagellar biosynthesis anti-sigma factor FlgM [Anoxybacillus flavithermus]|uniref:Negative regulator of flagellin synthesis n=1 Tax=Anoxybacillus flavithermus AK1 TaxID=1297581 RepID=M8DN78_9BACL|nr:flagellar biosynthesis anti-sigma factor FlgM [Anoxybacillus flavithermus]EMT45890.1 Negative regulator of flagellin synthesis [Anoxybacillus flavithermus AK1]
MKIHRIQPMNVNPYERTARIEKPTKATKKTDQVEISSAAKELQEAARFSSERLEKVERLKEEIESGAYKLDARAVAESVLRYYKR